MDGNTITSAIRSLITRDDLNRALALLGEHLQNHHLLDEVIIQSAKLKDLDKNVRMGLTVLDQQILIKNKIRKDVLDIVREFEIVQKLEENSYKELIKIEPNSSKGDSILAIEEIKAKKDIELKANQEKSSIKVKGIESQEGKVKIDINQK